MSGSREYLGDSVYVKFDGCNFILYLDNGMGEHNCICMEPEVLTKLNNFVERVRDGNKS